MKVKCEKCGKSFDYDKYYGICPKCGRYMSKQKADVVVKDYQQQPSSYEIHNEDVYNTNGKSTDTYNSNANRTNTYNSNANRTNTYNTSTNNGQYDNRQNTDGYQTNMRESADEQQKRKKKIRHRIQIGFDVAIVILMLILPAFFDVYKEHKTEQQHKEQTVESLEIEQQEVGTAFECQSHTLTIEQAQIYKHAQIKAPDGMKYIMIPYTFARSTGSYQYSTYVTTDVYLQVGTEFSEPLSPYNMTENETVRDELNEEIRDYLSTGTAQLLVFQVPEDQSSFTLLIYEKHRNSSGGSYVIDKVDSLPVTVKEAE